jgi:uncharacterized protein (DUF302 family)
MIKPIAISAICLAASACAAGPSEKPHAMSAPAEMTKERHGPHIITTQSNIGFEKTLAQLRAAIDKRGFKTFAVIDHAAGAASIGENLRPTTLVIFGNPKGGTPLMQAEQAMGLQLPLKILVAEDAQGVTNITYPDMAHLFHEYGIAELTTPLQKIEGALHVIAEEAAAP